MIVISQLFWLRISPWLPLLFGWGSRRVVLSISFFNKPFRPNSCSNNDMNKVGCMIHLYCSLTDKDVWLKLYSIAVSRAFKSWRREDAHLRKFSRICAKFKLLNAEMVKQAIFHIFGKVWLSFFKSYSVFKATLAHNSAQNLIKLSSDRAKKSLL